MCTFIGIILASVAYYVLGALWYSPVLFGKTWVKLVGLNKEAIEKAKKKGMATAYVLTYVCGLIISFALCYSMTLLQWSGICAGFQLGMYVGLGFIATTQLPSVLFLQKSIKLYGIDAGYHVAGTVIAASIIGMFH